MLVHLGEKETSLAKVSFDEMKREVIYQDTDSDRFCPCIRIADRLIWLRHMGDFRGQDFSEGQHVKRFEPLPSGTKFMVTFTQE